MEIVTCKDCIHRPLLKNNKVIAPQTIYSTEDIVCPFLCDDAYYNRMPADHFFCFSGEKRKFALLIKNMTMPPYCDECSCFDISGDYPSCLLTHHSTGYNFNYREKRMDDCPLVAVEEKEVGGEKVFIEVAEKESD